MTIKSLLNNRFYEGDNLQTAPFLFFVARQELFIYLLYTLKKNQKTDAVFWKFCIIYTDRHLNEHFKTH